MKDKHWSNALIFAAAVIGACAMSLLMTVATVWLAVKVLQAMGVL